VARETVTDRWGNIVYLTEERWQHILETHDEMLGYRTHLLETIRRGRRKQDRLDPGKYQYSMGFDDLPIGFTHVIVLVKFSWKAGPKGGEVPNHFVLTAYQVYRGRR